MKKFVLALCLVVAGTAGCATKPKVAEETQTPSFSAAGTARPAQEKGQLAPAEESVVATNPAGSATVAVEDVKGAGAAAEEASIPDLKTVFFEFDSWLLSPDMRTLLSQNAKWLSANPAQKVRVEGHTDERGSDAYNLALGEKRAQAVRDYLVRLGLPKDRFLITSYGEEQPAVEGHDEQAWGKNRRVEFKVQK